MEMSDELRAEYDLRRLRVRKVGPGRKSFGETIIHLEADVAEMFPNSESVNEALRFLIKIAQENQFDDWLEGGASCVEFSLLEKASELDDVLN